MDLRNPPRNWRKNPPSLTTTVSLLSLMLLLGGMCTSRAASVAAAPMGILLDVPRNLRDSTDTLPDVFFVFGVGVSALFILVYVLRMKSY